METGRLIDGRYRVERLIKQGRVCAVYLGTDERFQRAVAIKVVPVQQVPVYRTAIRITSHLSHPHIISLYDLAVEHELLYLIQEYVQGDELSALQQVSAYEAVDFGCQICQALLYASSTSRKICHGDLTPTAVLLDHQGHIRVNNFALPSDFSYFESWSGVGSEGIVISDTDLSWGQVSAGRQADDTRAVALLLYQLLAGRPAGSTQVEPPVDGQLRFPRGTPPELCETIARALLRSHPQNINTVEALYQALETIADALEPPLPAEASSIAQPVGVLSARQSSPVANSWRGQGEEEEPKGTGKLVSALPVRKTGNTGLRLSAYRSGGNAEPLLEPAPDAPTTVADVPLNLSRRAAYREMEMETRRSPVPLLLLLGLLMFILFFVVGYFAGHLLLFH